MRPFKAAILLVSCLVLYLARFGLPAAGAPNSLAAYSETRSFRDALDGRSMEEAISGPVDKDTSSYGDRNSGAQSIQAPSMMLTIPANGNLQQQTSSGQQQQQSTDGGELEREAGPIEGQSTASQEPQQQMMEQKAARLQRNGLRQGMSSPVIMAMMQRSGRQQQQQQQVETESEQVPAPGEPTSTKSNVGPGEQGFGEEPAKGPTAGYPNESRNSYGTPAETNGAGQSMSNPQQPGYTQQQSDGANEQQAVDIQQQQQRSQASDTAYSGAANGQSLMDSNGNGNGYDQQQQQQMQAAKQQAMAAMMMKYSRSPANGSPFGDKKQPSSMARNAMMSLANKAAYMGTQQRQSAPAPMTMSNNYSGGSNGNLRQTSTYSRPGSSAMGSTGSRNMRRANQRRNEKKMSPVMVNAMLNKMASAMKEEGYAKNSAISAAMQMLKSPAGAEMIAQMLDVANGKSSDQYKRDMLSTMMQQQQKESAGSDQEYKSNAGQEEMSDYGRQSANGNGVGNGAGNGAKSIANYASSTMSPVGAMMNGAPQRSAGQMDYSAPRSRQTPAKTSPMDMMNFDNQRQVMQQQQQDEQTGYNAGQQQQQMIDGSGEKGQSAAMSPSQAPMGAPMQIPMPVLMMTMPVSKKEEEPQQQQQEMVPAVMMMSPQAPMYSSNAKRGRMNGFKQAYQQQQQQQQQQGDYDSNKPAGSQATKGAMARPADMSMMTSGYEQQQQQTDDYGAAPMGMAEPFAFDYKIDDNYGNNQYRKEESDKNGVVRGSYGYMDNSGIYRHVEYVADENGFRANIKSNEPGLSSEAAPSKGAQAKVSQMNGQQQNESSYGGSSSSALGQTDTMNNQQQQMYAGNNMMVPSQQTQQAPINEPPSQSGNTQSQQQTTETGEQ